MLTDLAYDELTPISPPTKRSSAPRACVKPGTGPHRAQMLLPTPKASDGTKGSPHQHGSKGDLTLPSAAIAISSPPHPSAGDRTRPPSPGGNRSSDAPHPTPPNPDEQAGPGSAHDSSNG
jgi:hypothetical protein